jgi:trk system potassium uptake protein TrkA
MKILIVGAGDIGFQLSARLFHERTDITLIESDPARVLRAREQVDAIVVQGHGASAHTLQKAGVADADLIAAMTDNDEVNILACQIAKRAGVKSTIARVRNPEFMLPDYPIPSEEMGVDHFIHPEMETAETVVRLIRQATTTNVIEFEDGKIVLVGIRLESNSPLMRIPLGELSEKHGNPPMRIVAVIRNQTTMIPSGKDTLIPGDQVFAVCHPEYVPQFIELTGKEDVHIEDVMILGGGLIGQFIARSLAKEKNVKIVESNESKSREIAADLPDTLIIRGDGTDIDLMAVEGLQDMDAFIAVTGDDETNIIATLLARHLRVKRTIALVNRVEYLPITSTIGMDAVVSKQLLTVNAVQRYIQEQEVAAIASVPGIDAHIMEFIVEAPDKITRKPLKETNFPVHALIGMVMRGDEYIIPRGDTHIKSGDRVIVFSLPGALSSVEKFFK